MKMYSIPEELVEVIFTMLVELHAGDSRTDISALLALCLVCRTWNRIATPLLYRAIRFNFRPSLESQLGEAKNLGAAQKTLAAKPHLQKEVRTLRVKYTGRLDATESAKNRHFARAQLWITLLRLFPKLEHLDLLQYTWLPIPTPLLCSYAPSTPPTLTVEHSFLLPLKRIDIAISVHNFNALPIIFQLPNLEVLHLACRAVNRVLARACWPAASSNVKELFCTGLRIDGSPNMGMWWSDTLGKMGRACRGLEKLRIVLEAESRVRKRLYVYIVQGFAKHFVTGSLKCFEMYTMGGCEGYEEDESHSVFHYFAVNGAHSRLRLEETKLDLLGWLNKEGRVDDEGLPVTLRQITIRIPNAEGSDGGRGRAELVFDWLESMQDSLSARFPALERVIVEVKWMESTLGRVVEVKEKLATVDVRLVAQDASDNDL